LQALGWADGQNVRIDARGTSAIVENFRKHAAELVAATPDVVLAITTNAVLELQKASRTVPIVFTQVIDPVGSGLVRNLARPGGNVTGFLTFEYSISAKWLDLLKEIAPGVTRIAVLRTAAAAAGIGQFSAIQTVAPIGLELSVIGTGDAAEVERGIAEFAGQPNGGLVVTASGFGANHPPLIAALVKQPDFSTLTFTINGSKFLYGEFINALLSFLIIAAAVYFFVVVPINALIARARKEPPADPTTRKCGECLSEIPIGAHRCAFCTSPQA